MKRHKRYKRHKDLVKDSVNNAIKRRNERNKYWNHKVIEAAKEMGLV